MYRKTKFSCDFSSSVMHLECNFCMIFRLGLDLNFLWQMHTRYASFQKKKVLKLSMIVLFDQGPVLMYAYRWPSPTKKELTSSPESVM